MHDLAYVHLPPHPSSGPILVMGTSHVQLWPWLYTMHKHPKQSPICGGAHSEDKQQVETYLETLLGIQESAKQFLQLEAQTYI